jgi:hypothetical protein
MLTIHRIPDDRRRIRIRLRRVLGVLVILQAGEGEGQGVEGTGRVQIAVVVGPDTLASCKIKWLVVKLNRIGNLNVLDPRDHHCLPDFCTLCELGPLLLFKQLTSCAICLVSRSRAHEVAKAIPKREQRAYVLTLCDIHLVTY